MSTVIRHAAFYRERKKKQKRSRAAGNDDHFKVMLQLASLLLLPCDVTISKRNSDETNARCCIVTICMYNGGDINYIRILLNTIRTVTNKHNYNSFPPYFHVDNRVGFQRHFPTVIRSLVHIKQFHLSCHYNGIHSTRRFPSSSLR